MRPSSQLEQHAAKALKQSVSLVAEIRKSSLRLGNTRGSSSGTKRVFTGQSYAAALQTLLQSGADEADARAALDRAILARFRSFAGSWQNWITDYGWMYELAERTPEEIAEFEKLCGIDGLTAAAQKIKADPVSLLMDWSLLATLARYSTQYHSDEQLKVNPAIEMLVRKHGLHRELARAVVLCSRDIPAWAFCLFIFMTGLLWLLSIVAWLVPESQAFGENGAGPAQQVVAPLMAALISFVLIVAARQNPRRRRLWQAQLQRWREAIGV